MIRARTAVSATAELHHILGHDPGVLETGRLSHLSVGSSAPIVLVLRKLLHRQKQSFAFARPSGSFRRAVSVAIVQV